MKRLFILFFLGLILNLGLYANILNVPTDNYSTIQTGIDSALIGDTVLVQPGTYLENIGFEGKNIVLASLFLTTGDTAYISQTIIDGNKNGTVVEFRSGEDSTARLIGFFITNGYHHPGGGIYIRNSDPIISNCILIDNIAESSNGIGGGIYFENSTSKLYKTKIINNSAIGMDINNGWGGGVGCYNSDIEIINCRISGNNTTSISGGIGIIDSDIKIIGCEISNNSVEVSGAGLYFQDSNPILINNTIAHNSSNSQGSGFFYLRSDPIVINSIIWYNKTSSGFQNISGTSGVVDITYSNIQDGNEGTGNLNIDPLFADTTNGDYRITSDSPCIDSGTPDTTDLYLSDWDLDDNYRIWDGDLNGSEIIDMGAYEYGSIPVVSINQNLFVKHMNFKLHQNYPNPFNPVTTIEYTVRAYDHTPIHVNLSIYNLLGQKVATLVSEKQAAGLYEVQWDASRFSSGLYYYRIQTPEFQAVRKMILLR
jgi:parallel beta-helix repeat protein